MDDIDTANKFLCARSEWFRMLAFFLRFGRVSVVGFCVRVPSICFAITRVYQIACFVTLFLIFLAHFGKKK